MSARLVKGVVLDSSFSLVCEITDVFAALLTSVWLVASDAVMYNAGRC